MKYEHRCRQVYDDARLHVHANDQHRFAEFDGQPWIPDERDGWRLDGREGGVVWAIPEGLLVRPPRNPHGKFGTDFYPRFGR